MSPTNSNQRTYSVLRAETLQMAAKSAHAQLPDTHGFLLIVTKFGDGTGEGGADYVSNIKRDDAIKVLKTILFRWGANEEWMTNIK